MHTHPNGLPLDTVNSVSATTTGAFDIFLATIHRHCSPLLTSTLVVSLVITATSSIAPAACELFPLPSKFDSNLEIFFFLVLSVSAGSIWIDVDNSTFSIGALPKDSFLMYKGYVVDILVAQNLQFTIIGRPHDLLLHDGLLQRSSAMTWVENILNLTNGYYKVNTSSEGDQFEYLVPFPPAYTSTMKAYWTTDVIVLDPSCTWQTPTTARLVNSSWDVTLAESNLSVSISKSSIGMFFLFSNVFKFMCLLEISIKI